MASAPTLHYAALFLPVAIFKGIVYKTPLTSLDELKLRTVDAFETGTRQMLEDTWWKIEYRLDILRATRDANVEVV